MNTRQLLTLIVFSTVCLSLSREVSCAIWRGKGRPPGGEDDNAEDEAAPEDDIEESEDEGEAGSGRGSFRGYKNRVGMKLDFIESLPTGLKGKGGSRMATLVGSGKEGDEDSEEADEEDDDDQLHSGRRGDNKLKSLGKPKVPKGAEDANEEEDVKLPGKKGIKPANGINSDLMGNIKVREEIPGGPNKYFNIPGTRAKGTKTANELLPMGKTKVEEIDDAGEIPEEETDDAGEIPKEETDDAGEIPKEETDDAGEIPKEETDDAGEIPKEETDDAGEIPKEETDDAGEIPKEETDDAGEIPKEETDDAGEIPKEETDDAGEIPKEETDDAGEIPKEETDDAEDVEDPNDDLDIPVEKDSDVGNKKKPQVKDEPEYEALGKEGSKEGNEIEPNLMGKVKLSPDGVQGSNQDSDIPVGNDSKTGNESSPDEVPDNENSDTLDTKYPESNKDSKEASTKPNPEDPNRGPTDKIKSEDEEDEEDAENADPMKMLQRNSPRGKFLGPPSHLNKKMKNLIVVLTMEYESLMKALYPDPLKHPPPRKYLLWDKIKFRKPLFLKKISSPYGKRLSKL